MELRDFVAETLKEIVEGVAAAQEAAKEKGAVVNPRGLTSHEGLVYYEERGAAAVQMVDFDISLTESRSGETKGGIGVFFGYVGLGAQGRSETGSNAMNRVKFSVPIMLPRTN